MIGIMAAAKSAKIAAKEAETHAATPCLQRPAFTAVLDDDLRALIRSASEALCRSVQEIAGAAEGDVSTESASLSADFAACEAMAAALEARGRALLLQPDFPTSEVSQVTRTLRCTADMRCVIRGAREAAALAHLVRQEAGSAAAGSAALEPLCAFGVRAVALARVVASSLESFDLRAARGAATAFRDVDQARARTESALCNGDPAVTPEVRRMTGAIAWSVAIAAENMARAAARFSVPA